MSAAHGFIGVPLRTAIPKLCARCHSDPDFMRRYNPRERVGSVANRERAGVTACVLGGSYAAMPKIVWMTWRCATASPLATQRT